VNWFRHYGNGVHAGEWLSLAMVILLALVAGIALLKLVIWLLTPERDKDESEEDYWRRHDRCSAAKAKRGSSLFIFLGLLGRVFLSQSFMTLGLGLCLCCFLRVDLREITEMARAIAGNPLLRFNRRRLLG
jgi:hypothetical protein